jgi:hypothetical protein
VETGTARALVVVTPGGLEDAFHATAGTDVDAEAIGAALAARGVTVVGPPPSVPGWGAHMTA